MVSCGCVPSQPLAVSMSRITFGYSCQMMELPSGEEYLLPSSPSTNAEWKASSARGVMQTRLGGSDVTKVQAEMHSPSTMTWASRSASNLAMQESSSPPGSQVIR